MSLRGVHHIAYIVEDFNEAHNFFVNACNIPIRDTFTVGAWTGNPETEITIFDLKNVYIQVMKPISPKSKVHDVLLKKGEGFYRISYGVTDIVKARDSLITNGFKIQTDEIMNDFNTRVIEVDPFLSMGLVTQFAEPSFEHICRFKNDYPEGSLLKGIHHIAILVKDFDASKRLFVDTFGLPIWDIHSTGIGPVQETMILEVGGVYLEIIRPYDEKSRLQKSLKERGEGFLHLAYEVSDIEKAVDVLDSKGIKISSRGITRGYNWKVVNLDVSHTMGVQTQLVEPIWEIPSKFKKDR